MVNPDGRGKMIEGRNGQSFAEPLHGIGGMGGSVLAMLRYRFLEAHFPNCRLF